MRGWWRLPVALAVGVFLLTTCCLARSIWVSQLVEKPVSGDISLIGTVTNVADWWYLNFGRDLAFVYDHWTMKLEVSNQGSGLLSLYLADSSIVTPSGESETLASLMEGGLCPSVPPGAKVVDDGFSLPVMTLSYGDVISLFLVWGDSKGIHSGFWRWSMKQVGIPEVQPSQPSPSSPDLEAKGLSIGFPSLPTFGRTYTNQDGNLTTVKGVNILFGISRRYFSAEDGLQPYRFNGYWGWGTFALLLPYFELGFSYPFRLGGVYITIDVGLIYIVPWVGISFYF